MTLISALSGTPSPFSGAGQPVEKGGEVIVRMAIIGEEGPTGTFWENEGESMNASVTGPGTLGG
jgi:hypothetical protein